jgi:hypothetical protein
MPTSTPPKGNQFGTVIDLSKETIRRGPRGKQKEYFPDLLKLLGTLTKGTAVAITFYVVDRSTYPSTDAGETSWKNEKQRVGAILRSHAREAGFPKVGIDWEPDKHFPQVSLKG